jgi:hypothetical protein
MLAASVEAVRVTLGRAHRCRASCAGCSARHGRMRRQHIGPVLPCKDELAGGGSVWWDGRGCGCGGGSGGAGTRHRQRHQHASKSTVGGKVDGRIRSNGYGMLHESQTLEAK